MHPLLKLICWLFVHAVVHWHVATFAYAIVPKDDVVRDRVSVIEQNFFFDENGRLVFEQQLYIQFKVVRENLIEEIADWRLVKTEWQAIQKDHASNEYFVRWHDGEVWREVRSRNMRVQHLQYDSEVLARETLPKEDRRPLSGKVRK